MTFTTPGGNTYPLEAVREMCLGLTMEYPDGECSACGEVSTVYEVDAEGYDCPFCEAEETVTSVPILLGLV